MTKYRIINPNNKEVQEYLSTLSLCKAKKSRTTEIILNLGVSCSYG